MQTLLHTIKYKDKAKPSRVSKTTKEDDKGEEPCQNGFQWTKHTIIQELGAEWKDLRVDNEHPRYRLRALSSCLVLLRDSGFWQSISIPKLRRADPRVLKFQRAWRTEEMTSAHGFRLDSMLDCSGPPAVTLHGGQVIAQGLLNGLMTGSVSWYVPADTPRATLPLFKMKLGTGKIHGTLFPSPELQASLGPAATQQYTSKSPKTVICCQKRLHMGGGSWNVFGLRRISIGSVWLNFINCHSVRLLRSNSEELQGTVSLPALFD